MAVCGITVDAGYEALRVSLLQNAMLIAGIVTFLQLHPIGPIGGRPPIFMGTFSGFIGVNKAIAVSMMAGIIAGYFVSFLMGLVLPHTTVINKAEVVCGYITNWAQVKDAAWFAIPQLMPVKFQFNVGAIVPMLIMFIVTAVETVGDTAGVVQGGLDREATDKELSGAVVCDGFGSSLASLFGVLPNTSFSQNVGLVGMTKVVNRFAIAMGAGILVLAGLFPKIGALISVMPQPVLGGAAVMMFASIVISGINLLTSQPMKGRSATIVAVALGLGYGIGSTTAVQAMMPTWMTYIFGGSGIVPAALLAILLNIVLPQDKN